MQEPLLQVNGLKTYFYTRSGVVKAVDGVSFSVREGETLALVGESGSGKSVTALSVVRLVPAPAGRIVGGQVFLRGDDLLKKSDREMQKIRGKRISMILQDPMTSLDPVFSIGYQVAEPIKAHQPEPKTDVLDQVKEMLGMVRIPEPERRMLDYPHQMSGGMRQRIVGAMALACQPELLIADEPTTSLDVTIQAQFLSLLKEIQKKSGVAMIIITHDFGIVAKICDRVAVMYAGRIVETADVRTLFRNPAHPYTIALMKSLPKLGHLTERLFSIEGQPPDLRNTPKGCSFEPRCPEAMEICRTEYPPQFDIGNAHSLFCWLLEDESSDG